MHREAQERRAHQRRMPGRPPSGWWRKIVAAAVKAARVVFGALKEMAAVVTAGLVIVGAFFVKEQYDDRRESRVIRAWSVVRAAQGVDGNVGQVEALEALFDLEADLRSLNMKDMYLRDVELPGADLSGANFDGADLQQANLSGAILGNASFRGADLELANLSNIYASSPVDFTGAWLLHADLKGGYLDAPDFRCAALVDADLSKIEMGMADFTLAHLGLADLTDASIGGAFANTRLDDANLSGVWIEPVPIKWVMQSRLNSKEFDGATAEKLFDRERDDEYVLTEEDVTEMFQHACAYKNKMPEFIMDARENYILDLGCELDDHSPDSFYVLYLDVKFWKASDAYVKTCLADTDAEQAGDLVEQHEDIR